MSIQAVAHDGTRLDRVPAGGERLQRAPELATPRADVEKVIGRVEEAGDQRVDPLDVVRLVDAGSVDLKGVKHGSGHLRLAICYNIRFHGSSRNANPAPMADQCGLAEHHGQRIAVLETEFGGMQDVLTELYVTTENPEHRVNSCFCLAVFISLEVHSKGHTFYMLHVYCSAMTLP